MKKKTKWYGVARGHMPGVYENWDAALRQVTGYHRPKHCSFESKKEAQDWVLYWQKRDAADSIPDIFAPSLPTPVAYPSWQPIAQCPPPPFTHCNVVFENEAGEMELYSHVVYRTPEMRWHSILSGLIMQATSDRFRYFMLIPDWPVV